MRHAIRVAGVAAALVLCAASATSYQSAVKNLNLGGGVFMVIVEVNRYTSAATARGYAFQRAAEVCRGAGFSIVDAEGGSYSSGVSTATTSKIGNTYVTTTNNGGTTHDFTLLYSCNRPNAGRRNVPQSPPVDNLPQ